MRVLRLHLIGLFASAVYLLKMRQIRRAGQRFVVFTGTAGKSTTRDMFAHLLKSHNIPHVSRQSGYTNQLGVMLSILDIADSSAVSWSSLKKIWRAIPPKNAFILIELGADIVRDMDDFLVKFDPYAVCLTDIDAHTWAYPYEEIRADRMKLLSQIQSGGFVCYEDTNLEAVGYADAFVDGVTRVVVHVPLETNASLSSLRRQTAYLTVDGCRYTFPRYLFHPQQKAAVLALSMHKALIKSTPKENVYSTYNFLDQRLEIRETRNGALIVSDVYKSIPLCAYWLLKFAGEIPARERVVVVSEFRPSVHNPEVAYRTLGALLSCYTRAYFVGSDGAFRMLGKGNKAIYLGKSIDVNLLAKEILDTTTEGDLIVLKGAERFGLAQLGTLLTTIKNETPTT